MILIKCYVRIYVYLNEQGQQRIRRNAVQYFPKVCKLDISNPDPPHSSTLSPQLAQGQQPEQSWDRKPTAHRG
jgi:hypothetical protein